MPPLFAANTGIIEFTNNIAESEAIFTECGEIIEKENEII